jgi:predicted translin family RNA/ssDNA-binding protein
MSGFGKKLNNKIDDHDEYSRLSKKYRKIKKLCNSSIHEINRMDGKEPKIDWTEYEQEVDEYYENNPIEYEKNSCQNSLSEFLEGRGEGQTYDYMGEE